MYIYNCQVKQRASEVSYGLDFVTALDRGQEFKDLLNNEFDFGQFKVFIAYLCFSASRQTFELRVTPHCICFSLGQDRFGSCSCNGSFLWWRYYCSDFG